MDNVEKEAVSDASHHNVEESKAPAEESVEERPAPKSRRRTNKHGQRPRKLIAEFDNTGETEAADGDTALQANANSEETVVELAATAVAGVRRLTIESFYTPVRKRVRHSSAPGSCTEWQPPPCLGCECFCNCWCHRVCGKCICPCHS